ncbi:UBP1-associated protein 2C-like [Gastrolobium bilobum]|uniref:UBP1-associated protein 2C-like n=1 Tax=Gastrolobium bilobum TaxID=150636 RepID=UPI002AB0DF24|nr:UBP1-associated protein 2C-like [Gastrolobium bilobum]
MEFQKKQKIDEGGHFESPPPPSSAAIASLTPEEILKIIKPFDRNKVIDILETAALRHPEVLNAIRSVADRDTNLRKLFVRGLGGDTTSASLHEVFSAFGPIDEAAVIYDKATGRSKGYGFVTFTHVDGAVSAVKETSKIIDGRMTVSNLASVGVLRDDNEVWTRKIFVGNVPFDMSPGRLLTYFETFGEVEEGPLGFEKWNGKTKGFAFFVYKTEEGAKASLVEPIKTIDGFQVNCKLAIEGKKGRPLTTTATTSQGTQGFAGDGMNGQQQFQQQQQHAPTTTMDQSSQQYWGYGYGYAAHHAPLPGPGMQSSSFGNPYGYGYGGYAYDYGGSMHPNYYAGGIPAGGFGDGYAHQQQPMQVPTQPPQGTFQGMLPYQ